MLQCHHHRCCRHGDGCRDWGYLSAGRSDVILSVSVTGNHGLPTAETPLATHMYTVKKVKVVPSAQHMLGHEVVTTSYFLVTAYEAVASSLPHHFTF